MQEAPDFTLSGHAVFGLDPDLLARLNAGLAEGTLMRTAIKPYVRADLLVID